jgi:hypothetical protein
MRVVPTGLSFIVAGDKNKAFEKPVLGSFSVSYRRRDQKLNNTTHRLGVLDMISRIQDINTDSLTCKYIHG